MNDELIKNEVIKYQESYIEELEQQIALLKRTILKQKYEIQVLIKKNHKKELDLRKEQLKNIEYNQLGYNPYQE